MLPKLAEIRKRLPAKQLFLILSINLKRLKNQPPVAKNNSRQYTKESIDVVNICKKLYPYPSMYGKFTLHLGLHFFDCKCNRYHLFQSQLLSDRNLTTSHLFAQRICQARQGERGSLLHQLDYWTCMAGTCPSVGVPWVFR